MHLKEIIDIKQNQTTLLSKLENKLALVTKERDTLSDKVDELESDLTSKQLYGISNSSKSSKYPLPNTQENLLVQEHELQINMLKYKHSKEKEALENRLKSQEAQYEAKLCKKTEDFERVKKALHDQLNNLKDAHMTEKIGLNKYISNCKWWNI
jgi:chromosome segregation ATPase